MGVGVGEGEEAEGACYRSSGYKEVCVCVCIYDGFRVCGFGICRYVMIIPGEELDALSGANFSY